MSEDPGEKIRRLMRQSVPDTSNVADFAAAARKRGRSVAQPAHVMKISGSHSAGIIGNNNHVNITVKAPPNQRARIEIQRGSGDITEGQAAEIQELVAKVVAVSDRPFPAVWGALKKEFRFGSYRLMPIEQFEIVRAYLRRWIASTSAPGNAETPAVRKRALGRIHAEAKKVPGMIDQVRSYASDRFGAESLGDLAVGELHEVIRQFRL